MVNKPTIFKNKIAGVSILLVLSLALFVFIFLQFIWKSNLTSAPPIQPIASSTTVATTTASTSTSPTPPVTYPVPTPPAPVPPVVPSPVPQVPPQTVGHGVGFAVGDVLTSLSNANLNQRLDDIEALGVTWVRIDFEWGNVQYKSSASSDWNNYDRVVHAIIDHHLKVLGIISYTPTWARAADCTGGAHCPPKDPGQFATFAAQVVARYKDIGLRYWEIWNEPNNYDYWATKANCDAYTDLLKATYPAIKAVDPYATVITGGLSPASTDDANISPIDFLKCIYRNGGKGYFDAVAHHPYTFPQLPSSSGNAAWAQMSQTSTNLRGIMASNGDGDKKIWMTEFGAPTNGPDSHWYVSEERQGQMVSDALGLYKTYSWAGPIFFYTFKDSGTNTNTNENFFGITRSDGSQKPAYQTLKDAIAALNVN